MTNKVSKNDKAPEALELDPETLAGIRSLMAEEKPLPARQERPEPEPIPFTAEPSQRPETGKARPGFVPLAEPDAAPQPAAVKKKRKPSASAGRISEAKARLLAYRPTPRHIVLAGFALLVLFRPWLLFGLFMIFLAFMVGIFLVLGYDGFWRRTMGLVSWYARRRPSRSAAIHQKLDRFAMKWDAILDRFPEGTVDGLYLPDFGELAEAERRHEAALERRLQGLQESQG